VLAKLTSKNQITIPKKIIDQLPDVKYFDVELRNNTVVLKPVEVSDRSASRKPRSRRQV